MYRSRKDVSMSYHEYRIHSRRLKEAYNNGEYDDQDQGGYNENEWNYEEPKLDENPDDGQGHPLAVDNSPNELWNSQGREQDNSDQEQQNLHTLGMSERPRFAKMPSHGSQMAQAGPGPDDDPEDWQAKRDLQELSGVYGLKMGGVKSKDGSVKLEVSKGGLSPFKIQFEDYTSAMRWAKNNMGAVSKR